MKIKNAIKFIQGNEACAEAAIAAGVRFFAGYPITPSSEIAEILSLRLPQVGGKFIQMEDEIASVGAILGGSLAGAKTLTATSGPGFSLMQELLGFASLCEIPCVIVNIQRGGPSTGLPTFPAQGDVMQARWGTHGDHPIIVLAPSSVEEMYTLTIKAFNFSESLRIPVILLADEVVGHLYETINFDNFKNCKILERPKPMGRGKENYHPFKTNSPTDIPKIADFGDGFHFNVTGLIHDIDGFPTNDSDKTEALLFRLHKKINSRLKDICLYETKNLNDSSIILCSFGSTVRSSTEAADIVRKKGVNVGLINLKTLWPFPEFVFDQLKDKDKTVIVSEMNMGQIKREVERVSRGSFKVEGVFSYNGTLITPQKIIEKIETIR